MTKAHAKSIAIVGIGCRFPGGVDSHESFAAMLRDERQGVGEIPADRIDLQRFYDPTPKTPGKIMTRLGGFLSDIDQFDPEFFGLSPREAERMDPQQRLVLETSWEALEDAGVDAVGLKGGKVGVFLGQWVADFEQRLSLHTDEFDFPMTLGNGRYALSGRIAYLLGFMGPAMTIDTACSSSLVAVHLAAQSLNSGESDIALAGGVNVILGPHIHIAYSQGGMMAPDGRCKFGDARADGYVRSEGAGVVALKRLEDALRDGDRIHAVVLGSAVNNDGASSGSMGRPSVEGQRAAIVSALANAQVSPLEIGYVEAHGTGTPAGDRVEIGAIGAELGKGRPADSPLRVGSVKTNIGHTESAAGVAGLIKAVLTVRDGRIPASLNYETPSTLVDWGAAPVRIANEAEAWAGPASARKAGINGFGISGTNAHVIIEGPPERAAATDAPSRVLPLLPLSARSEASLRKLAGRLAERLAAPGAPPLDDILRFAQTRRAALEHRAAFPATSDSDLTEALKAFAAGGEAPGQGVANPRQPGKVALVFPGQGGQWPGMARDLLAQEPIIRESVERADAIIRREAGWSLLEQLALNPGDAGYLGDRIDVVQPTLGALEIAYAEWIKAAGLEADFVVGHSMGEAAAACAAGALSLEDALRVLCRRSALMRETSGQGAMAMVDLPAADLAGDLAGLEDKVSVGAVNSAHSTVISGDKAVVAGLVETFNARGVFSRAINVDVASHSPQMEGPSKALGDALTGLAPQDAATPFVSAVLGRVAPGTDLDATYWARNLREPVQFAAALEVLAGEGVTLFLEVGPHPVLSPSIERSSAGGDRAAVVACCGRREEEERGQLAAALGKLWCAGAPVDFVRGAGPAAPVVDFPLYPWKRRRLWVETADIARAYGAQGVKRAADREARDWMFRTVWRDLPEAADVGAGDAGWLVIGDDAAGLGAALGHFGASVETASLDELEPRLAALAGPVNLLVVAPKGEAAAFLPLRAAKALKPGAKARLWFATRDAQAPQEGQRVDVDHAALAGAARVLADERPDIFGGVIDLSSAADAQDARAAAAWLLDAKGEDAAAVREGRVQVPRLTAVTDTTSGRIGWRADGAYLLTGGLGGVGLAVARAMAEEGARRLILMSRSGLPPRRTWTDIDPASPAGQRIAAVKAIEALGVSVQCPAVDVGDEAALAAFLADYAAEGWPPIRGVVHLAGVLDRRIIDETDEAQFQVALAGKLGGARALDRLLRDLDCFVLFSSTTTLMPQTGVAAYVAANAGLDALALDRRARGLPAIAIAWGQWQGGMLADASGQAVLAAQAQMGVGAFPPERGANLFSWAAAQPGAMIAVAPIDWRLYGHARAGRNEPLLKELKRAAGGAAPQGDGAPAVETAEDMQAVVREAVARVMQFRLDDVEPTKEFGAMGLTSLLALELRNRLERAVGRPLSATLAWNYPTVVTLAAHLSGGDKPAVRPAKAATAPAKTMEAIAAKVAVVAELSDADALLALRRRRKDAPV